MDPSQIDASYYDVVYNIVSTIVRSESTTKESFNWIRFYSLPHIMDIRINKLKMSYADFRNHVNNLRDIVKDEKKREKRAQMTAAYLELSDSDDSDTESRPGGQAQKKLSILANKKKTSIQELESALRKLERRQTKLLRIQSSSDMYRLLNAPALSKRELQTRMKWDSLLGEFEGFPGLTTVVTRVGMLLKERKYNDASLSPMQTLLYLRQVADVNKIEELKKKIPSNNPQYGDMIDLVNPAAMATMLNLQFDNVSLVDTNCTFENVMGNMWRASIPEDDPPYDANDLIMLRIKRMLRLRFTTKAGWDAFKATSRKLLLPLFRTVQSVNTSSPFEVVDIDVDFSGTVITSTWPQTVLVRLVSFVKLIPASITTSYTNNQILFAGSKASSTLMISPLSILSSYVFPNFPLVKIVGATPALFDVFHGHRSAIAVLPADMPENTHINRATLSTRYNTELDSYNILGTNLPFERSTSDQQFWRANIPDDVDTPYGANDLIMVRIKRLVAITVSSAAGWSNFRSENFKFPVFMKDTVVNPTQYYNDQMRVDFSGSAVGSTFPQTIYVRLLSFIQLQPSTTTCVMDSKEGGNQLLFRDLSDVYFPTVPNAVISFAAPPTFDVYHGVRSQIITVPKQMSQYSDVRPDALANMFNTQFSSVDLVSTNETLERPFPNIWKAVIPNGTTPYNSTDLIMVKIERIIAVQFPTLQSWQNFYNMNKLYEMVLHNNLNDLNANINSRQANIDFKFNGSTITSVYPQDVYVRLTSYIQLQPSANNQFLLQTSAGFNRLMVSEDLSDFSFTLVPSASITYASSPTFDVFHGIRP